jgi:hypothetical protein
MYIKIQVPQKEQKIIKITLRRMMVGCNWVFHIKYKVDGNIEKGANKIKQANDVI